MILKFKKLHPNAIIPTYKHWGDSGLSLHSVEEVAMSGGWVYTISTGIAVEIPINFEGQIRSRSGMAAKSGIFVLTGTIDSGYRGELKVVLSAVKTPLPQYYIKTGDVIAQLVIAPIEIVEPIEVEDLTETTRQEGGFGSTGR